MSSYFTIKKRVNAEGLTPIYLVYPLSRDQRTEIPIGIKVKPQDWDGRRKHIKKNHKMSGQVADFMDQERHRLESIVLALRSSGKTPTRELVKSLFLNEADAKGVDSNDFFSVVDDWIIRAKNIVSRDVQKDYRSLRKHLKCFEFHRKMPITFDQMDYTFYETFVEYLEYEVQKPDGSFGLARNTVGKQIKNLKAFLRKSNQRGIIDWINLEGWKTIAEPTEHVYLTPAELDLIENINLSHNPKLETVRHLLLIGCETGLRYSDFTRIHPASIDGKFIKLKTLKTMQNVVIPISPRLARILDFYNQIPPIWKNQVSFNLLVKEVTRIAGIRNEIQVLRKRGNRKIESWVPKWRLVCSHTCRRTFCTNAYSAGMPTIAIRLISGHVDDKGLFKYIRVNQDETAINLLEKWMAENLE